MHRTVLRDLSIPLFFSLSGALAGCDGAAAETTPDPVAVSPSTANVATCRSATFTATPADGVTWTLDGAGTLKDGVYAAPMSVPSPATATIAAASGAETGKATVTLASAFPEAAIDTGRADNSSTPDHVHGVAAHGSRVYALLEGGGSLAVARSDDGGLTWGAPSSITGGGDHIPAIAIDAGDDDTVYVTMHGLDLNAGSTLDLVVSTDGGKTFTAHRLFEGGNGEAQDADVASPAAGTVIVTAPATWQDGNGGQGATLLVWHDKQKGAGLPAPSPLDNGYGAMWAAGLEHRLDNGHLIETNDSRGGPQLTTNGKGQVCIMTNDYGINGGDEKHVFMCSGDGGATFGEGVTVTSGPPADLLRSRAAMSADGELIVVAYNEFDSAASDSIGRTSYAVSTDGGKTFSAPHTHPDAVDGGGQKLAVNSAEVFIDAGGVIWFARNVEDMRIQVDKSCDQGATLSGAFDLPISGSHVNGLFFESSAGLFAGGVRRGSTDMGLTVTRLLTP